MVKQFRPGEFDGLKTSPLVMELTVTFCESVLFIEIVLLIYKLCSINPIPNSNPSLKPNTNPNPKSLQIHKMHSTIIIIIYKLRKCAQQIL